MTGDPFGAISHGELFATAEVRTFLSEERRIAGMVHFETALARAQASCGVIPETVAATIEEKLADFAPDLAAIGAGTESAGVPVPALVAQLRTAVGGDASGYVHWGATSQDAIDTALVLVLRDVLDHFDARLADLAEALAVLARKHRETPVLARTRMQQAAPTTFGLKVAGWRAPLVRARVRLAELRPRLLVVQLGGAAGTLAPLGENGVGVRRALAEILDLELSALPWHSQRDAIVELSSWLSLLTGALGKIGLDVGLLAQSEVGELRETGEAGRGGSSTLPQKSNPVRSEALVTLARYNAHAVAGMHQALLHENERSGSAWSLEWLTLPNMVLAASGALAHGGHLASELVVDTVRMRSNIDASNGLCLAEAASFALSAHLPRADAQKLVGEACADVGRTGENLIAVLSARTDAPVDWKALARPENYLGSASAFVDAALADSGENP
ncbi:MAG: 3-carboxy-cis,cis-muconate cycloisomerase [Alphaproteobacteria bacterium]